MKKNLVDYGGDGFGGCPENGVYEVKATETKTFAKLSEARTYYDSLNKEKCIWNMTRGAELLAGKIYEFEYEDTDDDAPEQKK